MIITIAGNYGSGGLWVAKKAAEILNYRFLDDDTAIKMLDDLDLGISGEDFLTYDENKGFDSLSSLRRISAVASNSPYSAYFSEEKSMPLEAQYREALRHLSRDFAKDGNCVLVGRCAGYFLKPNPELICFFTTDDDSVRLKRIMDFWNCDENEAVKWMKKRDKRRAEYNKYFTESDTWGDPKHYDYIVHTNTLGLDGTAEMISEIVRIREKIAGTDAIIR